MTKWEMLLQIKNGFWVGSFKNGGLESRDHELVPASVADQPHDAGQVALAPLLLRTTVHLLGVHIMYVVLFSRSSCKTLTR